MFENWEKNPKQINNIIVIVSSGTEEWRVYALIQ